MLKCFALACGAILASLAITGHAWSDVSFCSDNSSDSCKKGGAVNDSTATVLKTAVTQESKHGCAGVTKTQTAKPPFNIHFNKSCTYKVKYKVTDGCTGDKDGRISGSDMDNGRVFFALHEACGSLKVKVEK